MKLKDIIRIKETDLLIELNGLEPSYVIEEIHEYTQPGASLTRYKLNHVGTDDERYLFVHRANCAPKPDYILTKIVLSDAYTDMKFNNPWLINNDHEFTDIVTVVPDNAPPDSTPILFNKKLEAPLWSPDSYIASWETAEPIIDYFLLAINIGYSNDNGGWVDFYEGRRFEVDELETQSYNL